MKLHYLPHYKFKINTKNSIEEVQQNIKNETLTHAPLDRLFDNSKMFSGKVDAHTFKITRTISYRNAWNPVISGEIKKVLDSTEVSVIMSLHPFVKAFSVFWIAFNLILLMTNINSFSGNSISSSLVMLGLLYAVTFITFNIEVKSAEQTLRNVINRRQPDDNT